MTPALVQLRTGLLGDDASRKMSIAGEAVEPGDDRVPPGAGVIWPLHEPAQLRHCQSLTRA